MATGRCRSTGEVVGGLNLDKCIDWRYGGRVAQRSNREALIDGATACLRRQGFARTTARDIAAESGANLASIGYHFGSKEALLNEALIRLFKGRNLAVGAAGGRADEATPAGRLRALFSAATKVLRAPKPVFVGFVEAIAQAGHTDDLRRQVADHYREARRAVGSRVAALSGRSDVAGGDVDALGAVVLALFDGLALQRILEPSTLPSADQAIDALVTFARPLLDDLPKEGVTI
jgi:AcrR family transcriptional regulator